MASRVESSGLSVVSEDRVSIKKCHDDEDDYPESVCNSKTRSAYLGGQKKKLHPLMLGPSRRDPGKYIPLHTASKNNLSEFTQRIMSAKLLRVKQVQNQLSETQIQLNELINENRILKNLQKRQEGALRKYEGNHAELPQLIRSHNEEIRALKASNKVIKAQLRESNNKLKERENELDTLKENYNKLKKLSSEKNLLEREKLQKKVEELQEVIREQDDKIQVLSRKILLESKSYRHHLNIEISKHKETQKDLNNALSMITRLENQLMMKDKLNWMPSGMGKLPHKREPKNLMASISNKSLEIPTNLTNADSGAKDGSNARNKNEASESPETDLELLNALTSSDDTSPTQDIFPDINLPKKLSPDIPFSRSEIRLSIEQGSESGRKQSGSGLRSRAPSVSKKSLRLSGDVESNARGILEKSSRGIETLDNLMQKNELNVATSKARLSSLYEEVKTKVSKMQEEINDQVGDDGNEGEPEPKDEIDAAADAVSGSLRRNVTKRKLDDGKHRVKMQDSDREDNEELTEGQQQKLLNMAKTWNDIKDKVQEEWMKAEQMKKELGMTDRSDGDNSSNSEAWDDGKAAGKDEVSTQGKPTPLREVKDLKFNFASDDYILNELEKTDKAFKRLKNEKGKKSKTKPSPAGPKKPPENMSFRTESHRAPKYLEEFQSEYQKQNLLKALKAIDVGKDGNSSSEEEKPERRERMPNTYGAGDSAVSRTTSYGSKRDVKTDLISELFGSKKLERSEKTGLEYGIVDGIKARNN